MKACAGDLLRGLDPRLFSVFSTGSHALLPHWFAHYASLGVDVAKARLILDNHSAPSAHAAATIVQAHGARVSWLNAAAPRRGTRAAKMPFREVRLQLLNDFIRSLPPSAWILPADVDEHYAYPCTAVAQLTRRAVGGGVQALCGKMLDRVAPDLQLRAVTRAPALPRQFPVCVPYRAERFARTVGSAKRAKTNKVTLLRARLLGGVPQFVDAHAARVPQAGGGKPAKLGGPTQSNCLSSGYFSHYSFTDEKAQIYNRSALGHDTSSLYADALDGKTRRLLRDMALRFASRKTAGLRGALGCGSFDASRASLVPRDTRRLRV